MAEADLSKIVNLIMENPDLVEQIRSLANSEEAGKEETKERVAEASTAAAEPPTYRSENLPARQRRTLLLSALKPYISPERGRAIETMIGIADALDAIKGG